MAGCSCVAEREVVRTTRLGHQLFDQILLNAQVTTADELQR